MPTATLQQKQFRCRDGTNLSYAIGGNIAGPAVVIANGLGGPRIALQYLFDELMPTHRVLTWDYRGLYNSERPKNMASLSIHGQMHDMKELMAAEHIDHAMLLGWSMGVQVAVEFVQHFPEQVSGLFLMCGVAGKPLTTLRGGRVLSPLTPTLMNIGKRSAKLVSRVTRGLASWQGFAPMMQNIRLVHPNIEMEHFRAISQGFAALDMEVFCETVKQLGEHDARHVLATISVPTVLLAGQHDTMAPVSTMKEMHRSIPNSQLHIIDGGTHYAPIEFPAQFLSIMQGFLPGVASHRTA